MEAVMYIIVSLVALALFIAAVIGIGLRAQARTFDQMMEDAEQEHVRQRMKHLRGIK